MGQCPISFCNTYLNLSICGLHTKHPNKITITNAARKTIARRRLGVSLPNLPDQIQSARLPSTTKTFFCRLPINCIWGFIIRAYNNDGYGNQWSGTVLNHRVSDGFASAMAATLGPRVLCTPRISLLQSRHVGLEVARRAPVLGKTLTHTPRFRIARYTEQAPEAIIEEDSFNRQSACTNTL